MTSIISTTRIPKYLTQPEARAFFEVIHRPRDRALFALIYLYGLRVSEASLIRRADVDLERKRIIVKRVKGGVWSERPLFEASEILLRAFLRSHRGDSDALFPGQNGPLKKRQIQALFARYRDEAGLPKHYTCHSLRHSIATHLLDAGLPMEFVQDHLGHKSIQSTTIYARVTSHHRALVFRKLEQSPWIVRPTVHDVSEDYGPETAKKGEVHACPTCHC